MRPALPVFLLASIALTQSAPAADPENRLFELRVYTPSEPGKLDALNARFREHTVKFFAKHGMTSIGFFNPADPKDERLVYMLAYKDWAARTAAWSKFGSDPEMRTALQASTAKHGQVRMKADIMYLSPTDYSPVVTPAAGGKERVFELRSYTAAPGKLDALNDRFREHTVKLFEKHGMTNIGYWKVATGEGITPPNASAVKSVGLIPEAGQKAADVGLVYLLAHPSAEAHDKAFAAFLDDADWKKALAASEAKAGGPLTVKDGVKSLLLKPTDFSPLK
jgi:hypothetical protein